MPDDLDRLFERLVSVLADDAPGRLAVPFPAAEVYERLAPYRSNRSTLKVATHQDHEMAVLRLLAGERGYASLEPPEAREALGREAGEQSESPRQCPYCGETLPGSRKVNFCPQCGQPPSGDLRCPACGGEVDVGWRYCVSCGRATGFE